MKKHIITIGKICLSISLLWYLIDRVGAGDFLRSLVSVEPIWLIGAVIVMTASNVLGAVQWHGILRNSSIDISVWQAVSYYYIGLFFNNVLPGYVGGDFFRGYNITKHSGENSKAVSTILFDRLIGLSTISLLAVMFGLFAWDLINRPAIVWSLIAFISLLLTVAVFFYFKRLAKKFQVIGEWLLPQIVHQTAHDIYNEINLFRYKKLVVFRLFLLSICVQGLRICMFYVVARGLHVTPLHLVDFFVLIPMIAIVALLPVSIGGVGVRENTGVLLFGIVGMAAESAFGLLLLGFLVGIVSSIPGLITFLIKRHGAAHVPPSVPYSDTAVSS